MNALNKKPIIANAQFVAAAEQLSKAALIDLCFDLLQGMHGDTSTLVAELKDRAGIVTNIRGDKAIKP